MEATMVRMRSLFLLLFLTWLERTVDSAELLRPRGVAISKAALYSPEGDFTCLDGSAVVPFLYVNDDYCDCQDGSDEPGTAACPNGTFHCTNAGHRPLNIPSSRVNDGICDCCDASDEYGSSSMCTNTCRELGRAARLEAQRQEELRRQGYEIRLDLARQGKQVRAEHLERLSHLEKEQVEAEAIKAEKEKAKEEVEGPEKDALEVYRVEREEREKKEEEERENARKSEAEDTFRLLDSNGDDKLDIAELQTRQTFDQNKDGVVSEEEAKFFLQMESEMSKDDFLNTGWLMMKPYFMLDKGLFLPPTDNREETREESIEDEQLPPEDQSTDEMDEDEAELAREMQQEPDDDSDSDEGEDDDEALQEDKAEPVTTEAPEPQYDEQTQLLIDAANKARSEFEEANRVVMDLSRDIRQIQENLHKEYGEDEEFASMDGECFEHQDNEYTYRFCPFDQVIQKPNQGGAEIRLGSWGNWMGPEGDRYSKMKYEKGQSCWNGPTRSTVVNLSCGLENKLTMVTEPSRCEYLAEFTTPAICAKLDATSDDHEHDEL